MSLLTETPSTILDNFADVIEGGNTHRGSGTAWPGVPGLGSVHELAGGAVTATSSGTTATVVSTTLGDTEAARLIRDDAPPFFLRCLTQAALTLNAGCARKITGYTASSDTFATGTWDQATASGDTFTVEEGFRRSPNRFALRDEPATAGFDRYFHLHLLPGKQTEWRGDGQQMWESTLQLRLRLISRRTDRTLVDSCLENLVRLRTVLVMGAYRDSLTQGLWADESEPEVEVANVDHVLLADSYRILYRLDSEFR